MKTWLLITYLITGNVISYSQFSISLGYLNSSEKKELNHHIFGLGAHWQHDRILFSSGLGLFQNSINYYSEANRIDNSNYHSYYGYGFKSRESIIFNANVSYRFIRLAHSLEWGFIDLKMMKLHIGGFIDFDIRIKEKENNHITLKESTVYNYLDHEVVDKTYTLHSPIFAAFDAMRIADEQVAFGIKISPRYVFGNSYLRLDLKTGFGFDKRVNDNNQSINHYEYQNSANPMVFDNFNDAKRPRVLSVGLSFGYTFKKKN